MINEIRGVRPKRVDVDTAPNRLPLALFSLIMMTCWPLHSAPKQMKLSDPLENQGLRAVLPPAPEFPVRLAELLDQPMLQKAAPLIPKSFILVNDTGRYIYSLTVIYTLHDHISESGQPWRYVFSKTAPVADRRVMFAPGDSFLFTPLAGFCAVFRPNVGIVRQPGGGAETDQVISQYVDEDSTADMTAVVDSVIFEDGTLSGPDGANRLAELNSRSQAEHEVRFSLTNLHGEELKKQLLYYGTLNGQEMYTRQLRDHALRVLRVLKDHGEDSAWKFIDALNNKKQIGLIRRQQ